MKPRIIFPASNRRFDLKGAEEYGDVVCLLDGTHIVPTRVQFTARKLRERLDEVRFDPTTDMIGMTGNCVMLSLLLAVVAARHPRHIIGLLVFDSQTEAYVFRELDTSDDTNRTANA